MREIVILPKNMCSTTLIESFFLEFFFKFMEVDIQDNRFDFNFLKEYYQICKEQNRIEVFRKTIEEFMLRGAVIHLENGSKLEIADLNREEILKLKAEEEGEINFFNEKLKNILREYHITSKRFFNGIILNNFRLIFDDISLDIFKSELERNRIRIEKEEEINKKIVEKTINNKRIEEYFYESYFENFREFCKERSIFRISQLTATEISNYRLMEGVGEKKYLIVLERFESIKNKKIYIDINELLYSLNLDQDTLELIEKRYVKNMTLSDIGISLKTTRQNINLKLDKIEEQLKGFFKFNDLIQLLKNISLSNKWITLSELEILLDKENRMFLEIFKSGNIIEYNEDLEFFILEEKINEKIREILQKIYFPNKIGTLEEIYEEINNENIDHELLDEILESIPLDKILENLGFKHYGEYFANKKLTNSEAFEIIMKNYVEGSVVLDVEGINQIKKIAENKFNLKLEVSEGTLMNALYSLNEVFLCGSKEYIHKNKINYSEKFIEKIHSYIKCFFRSEGNILNVDFIFKEFKKECEKERVWSKQLLYSILKYEYETEFTFGKGNTLNIYKDELKISREDQMFNYLQKFNKIDTKINIVNNLKWKLYQLDDTVCKSKKFILMEDKVALREYISLSKIEEESLLSEIRFYLRENLYYSTEVLFQNLLKKENIRNILKKYNLNNSKILSYFLRANNLIIDYKFINKLMFLVKKQLELETVEDIIKLKFQEKSEIERREIKEFYRELGYKEAMVSSIDSRLIEKHFFLEISKDKVILNEKFNLNENTIQKIKNFIEDKIKDKKYLILNDLDFRVLRISNEICEINPYSVKSLLIKYVNSYKFLKRINSDYRYDKIILVKKDENFENLEDLVYFLLKNEYKDIMEEVEIYDYLTSKGIVPYKQYNYDKKLFQSFKDEIYDKIHIDINGKVNID